MTNHHLLFLVACVSASASEGGPPARQLLGPGRQIAVGKLRRPIRLQPRQENAHAACCTQRTQIADVQMPVTEADGCLPVLCRMYAACGIIGTFDDTYHIYMADDGCIQMARGVCVL